MHESVNRLELPPALSAAHLDLAAGGAEALARRLRSNPQGMDELARAVLDGDPQRAREMLVELSLSEEDIRAEGGDVYLLVVVVLLLWATDSY